MWFTPFCLFKRFSNPVSVLYLNLTALGLPILDTALNNGNYQPSLFVGPVPGLPETLYFNIYKGQNISTKPQSRGSISAEYKLYLCFLKTKQNKTEWCILNIKENKTKQNTLPGSHKVKFIQPCAY